MSKAKRPRRKPDVSKGPQHLKSGWPRDNRPPRRGKSGSPLARGDAKRRSAGAATSMSGKPTEASDLSRIASSEAPRPKRGRKPKGKVEQPEQKFERRTLTTKEQQEMALRAVRVSVEARKRERKLKRETKAERDAIKELRARAEQLETNADQGFELVPEGDMFGDTAEKKREATGQPANGNGHAGNGNGSPKDTDEPLETDLERAERLEQAGAPA